MTALSGYGAGAIWTVAHIPGNIFQRPGESREAGGDRMFRPRQRCSPWLNSRCAATIKSVPPR